MPMAWLALMEVVGDDGPVIGATIRVKGSPNVAEDHQTKNAMALVNKDAAIYVKDADAPNELLQKAINQEK